uniref:Uncharacterized protein n=1 Tax=Anopheles merus TaxID=30066 RepID=A0A182VLK0_ANOME
MIVGGVVDEIGAEEEEYAGPPFVCWIAPPEDTVGDEPAAAGGGDSTFGLGWMTGACWDEGSWDAAAADGVVVVVVGEPWTTASSVCCRWGVPLAAGGLCGDEARPCDCEGEVACGCREGLRESGNPIMEPVGELDRA